MHPQPRRKDFKPRHHCLLRVGSCIWNPEEPEIRKKIPTELNYPLTGVVDFNVKSKHKMAETKY